MDGLAIQSVTPQRWTPGFVPQAVGLKGGWHPRPLPAGPADVNRQLGVMVLSNMPEATLGQQSVAKDIKKAAIAVLLPPTIFGGVVTYVGFRLGSKDAGFPSFLGYAVGALAGITTLVGVLAMFGIASVPIPSFEVPAPEAAPSLAPAPAPAPGPKRPFEVTEAMPFA